MFAEYGEMAGNVQTPSIARERKPSPAWRGRLGRLFAMFTVLLLVLVVIKVANIGVNLTESLPVGFYHIDPVNRDIRVGDLVEVCIPKAAEEFALQRHYVLNGGPCPSGSIYFLKMVVAIGGDTVALTDRAVSVNGHELPHSPTFSHDKAGLPLPHVPRGTYHLKSGQLWLWTPNPRSWDSRYYGPADAASVAGFEHLLLAVQPWPYLDKNYVFEEPSPTAKP